jgi:hypothetical protein
MSTFYEVQEFTASGWQNTWVSPDNWAYYKTEKEAQSDLDCHLKNCADAVSLGYMMDAPSLDSFRIVEVADSIALKGL